MRQFDQYYVPIDIPDSVTTTAAAIAEYNINLTAATATTTARTSGVTSNAFGVYNNQGIVLLSLSPEELFPLFERLKSVACKYAKLAR